MQPTDNSESLTEDLPRNFEASSARNEQMGDDVTREHHSTDSAFTRNTHRLCGQSQSPYRVQRFASSPSSHMLNNARHIRLESLSIHLSTLGHELLTGEHSSLQLPSRDSQLANLEGLSGRLNQLGDELFAGRVMQSNQQMQPGTALTALPAAYRNPSAQLRLGKVEGQLPRPSRLPELAQTPMEAVTTPFQRPSWTPQLEPSPSSRWTPPTPNVPLDGSPEVTNRTPDSITPTLKLNGHLQSGAMEQPASIATLDALRARAERVRDRLAEDTLGAQTSSSLRARLHQAKLRSALTLCSHAGAATEANGSSPPSIVQRLAIPLASPRRDGPESAQLPRSARLMSVRGDVTSRSHVQEASSCVPTKSVERLEIPLASPRRDAPESARLPRSARLMSVRGDVTPRSHVQEASSCVPTTSVERLEIPLASPRRDAPESARRQLSARTEDRSLDSAAPACASSEQSQRSHLSLPQVGGCSSNPVSNLASTKEPLSQQLVMNRSAAIAADKILPADDKSGRRYPRWVTFIGFATAAILPTFLLVAVVLMMSSNSLPPPAPALPPPMPQRPPPCAPTPSRSPLSLLPRPPPSSPPPPQGCMDSQALNYRVLAVHPDPNEPCIRGGCLDSRLRQYDSQASFDDGRCAHPLSGCTDPDALNYRPLASLNDGSCTYVGCLDSFAPNYAPLASLPGLCTAWVRGCTDSEADNFHPSATLDIGTCVVLGCTDSTRRNYDSLATINAGTCASIYAGCTHLGALNYHVSYNVDDGSCLIAGCTDATASNFQAAATFDDGSCAGSRRSLLRRALQRRSTAPQRKLAGTGCMAPGAPGYDSLATAHDETACGNFPVFGCMNSLALNYMSEATAEMGSDRRCQELLSYGCMHAMASNFDSLANRSPIGSCVYLLAGCTDSDSPLYASAASIDDGSCVYPVYGCADPRALNFDSQATVCGSCEYPIVGCMDPLASNFASDANIRAELSCIYSVYGCLFQGASNYDSAATVGDGVHFACMHTPSTSTHRIA